MTTIESIRATLEDLARGQELGLREQSQRQETTQTEGNDSDSVQISAFSLRRMQASLDDAAALTSKEAFDTLEQIQNASQEELLNAHQGLDASRVFALLGIDE